MFDSHDPKPSSYRIIILCLVSKTKECVPRTIVNVCKECGSKKGFFDVHVNNSKYSKTSLKPLQLLK